MAKLGKLIESAIKKFAISEYPKEACGVIIKRGRKLVAVQCKNISDNPEHRFVIGSQEYRAHIDQGGVYGIWHTHVNESQPLTPSQTDIAACNATGVDWIIVDIASVDGKTFSFGKFFFIEPEDIEEEYVERPYIYGVKDCFTLARDYYRKEFGIAVDFIAEGYPEVTDWQLRGNNMLIDSYKDAGFARLFDETPAVGDLFLIQMSPSIADHIAVYLGDDKILHHCVGRLSTIDIYGGGFWQKHTVAHLRHQSFIKEKQ